MANQEELIPAILEQQTDDKDSKLGARTKLGAAATTFVFQQSPLNESVRAYVGASLLEMTHNPLLVGAGVGLTTLAIEGGSGTSIAMALRDNHEALDKFDNLMDRLRRQKVLGLFMRQDQQKPQKTAATDINLALTVGAGAVITRRYREDRERSVAEDRSTIAKTAGGIAIFSAGIGALAGGGIEYAEKIGLERPAEITVDLLTDWRTYGVALAAMVAYKGIRNGVDNLFKKNESAPVPYKFSRITDEVSIKKALELEQKVWDEKGFGSLEEYEKYLPQSRIFAAFDSETGECVGSTRQFAGGPELPPFLAKKKDEEVLPISDPEQRVRLIEGCQTGEVEEFGTWAVGKSSRGGEVSLALCKMAYRDAYSRGVKTWGIIMEPERVAKMNKRLHFCFEQIGEPVDYQGGMCAVHILDLEKVREYMHSKSPKLFEWFVNEPIETPLPLREVIKSSVPKIR